MTPEQLKQVESEAEKALETTLLEDISGTKELLLKLLPPHEFGENDDAEIVYNALEAAEKFISGAHYRDGMEGMRWVKASSDNLPDECGSVHWRDAKTKLPISATSAFMAIQNGHHELAEWLDEQATPDSEVKRLREECQHPFYDCYKKGLQTYCGKCQDQLT